MIPDDPYPDPSMDAVGCCNPPKIRPSRSCARWRLQEAALARPEARMLPRAAPRPGPGACHPRSSLRCPRPSRHRACRGEGLKIGGSPDLDASYATRCRGGSFEFRRGGSFEAGVESNHTWRGRPLPAQNHKSRRERERNDRETGERGERRERGDTQGSLPRENGQVWEGPRSCGPQTTHHHMIF